MKYTNRCLNGETLWETGYTVLHIELFCMQIASPVPLNSCPIVNKKKKTEKQKLEIRHNALSMCLMKNNNNNKKTHTIIGGL